MPEPTCPFCEAPLVNVRTIPATEHCLGVEEKTFACDTMLSRCLTEGAPNPGGQLSALCESRQRLFDDVLARIFVEANFLQNTLTIQEDLDASIEGARAAVAARYPLPAKDAADADQAK